MRSLESALQSNRSPRQYEPVSSRRYATRRGKGILRLETAGGCDRHRPKISVSLGLILPLRVRKRRICRGYPERLEIVQYQLVARWSGGDSTRWPSRALGDLELLKATAGRPAGQRQGATRANGDCGVDGVNSVGDPEPKRTASLIRPTAPSSRAVTAWC